MEQLGHSKCAHLKSLPFLTVTRGFLASPSHHTACSVYNTPVVKDAAGTLGSAAARKERVSELTLITTVGQHEFVGVFLHRCDSVPAPMGTVEVDRGQSPEIHELGGLASLFQLYPRFAQWPSFL